MYPEAPLFARDAVLSIDGEEIGIVTEMSIANTGHPVLLYTVGSRIPEAIIERPEYDITLTGIITRSDFHPFSILPREIMIDSSAGSMTISHPHVLNIQQSFQNGNNLMNISLIAQGMNILSIDGEPPATQDCARLLAEIIQRCH